MKVLKEAPETAVNRQYWASDEWAGNWTTRAVFTTAKPSLRPEYVICKASILKYLLTFHFLELTYFLMYIEDSVTVFTVVRIPVLR